MGSKSIAPTCGYKMHVGSGTVHVIDFQKLSELNISPKEVVTYTSANIDTTQYL